MANDSRFGLAAYVHTRDLNRAHLLAAQLDVGSVAVNGGAAVAGPYAPFGGFKESGYGKEGGPEGVREFVRVKNVNIKLS
jgi:aldehyde dehydrogenase (NAD+)